MCNHTHTLQISKKLPVNRPNLQPHRKTASREEDQEKPYNKANRNGQWNDAIASPDQIEKAPPYWQSNGERRKKLMQTCPPEQPRECNSKD